MSAWTTTLDDKLRTLWAAGRTGSQIEKAMPEFSRSAVLAHVRRLGLAKRGPDSPMRGQILGKRSGVTFRAAPAEKPPKPASRVVWAKPRLPAPKPFKAPPEPTSATNVPLLGLGYGMCRYPIGPLMEKATLFCGGPAEEGCSWCGAHRLRVFQPAPQRRGATALVPELA